MTIAGLILDLMLISMLGVMIFYVVRLHKRLEVIRSGRHDLETLLRDLVENTRSAERGLLDLRANADYLTETLQKQITGANRTREELEFLLTSADKAADTLMERIGSARTASAAPLPDTTSIRGSAAAPTAAPILQQPIAPASSTSTANAAPADTSTRDIAEQDLLRAIEKLR